MSLGSPPHHDPPVTATYLPVYHAWELLDFPPLYLTLSSTDPNGTHTSGDMLGVAMDAVKLLDTVKVSLDKCLLQL